jgi:hypothetical protein
MKSLNFRLALAVGALVAALASLPAAAEMEREVHRANVNAIDSTGWQPAVSTKGAFSMRVPVPFHDFTVHAPSPGSICSIMSSLR